jgi:hypothetical protein
MAEGYIIYKASILYTVFVVRSMEVLLYTNLLGSHVKKICAVVFRNAGSLGSKRWSISKAWERSVLNRLSFCHIYDTTSLFLPNILILLCLVLPFPLFSLTSKFKRTVKHNSRWASSMEKNIT